MSADFTRAALALQGLVWCMELLRKPLGRQVEQNSAALLCTEEQLPLVSGSVCVAVAMQFQ